MGGEILTFPDTLTPRSRLTHLLPPLSLHRLSIRLRRGRSTTSTESVAPGGYSIVASVRSFSPSEQGQFPVAYCVSAESGSGAARLLLFLRLLVFGVLPSPVWSVRCCELGVGDASDN